MKITERGFTLSEVMFAGVIATILIVGAFTILQASNKQLNVIHAKMTLEEGPREALFKMAQEIRQTSKYEIDPQSFLSGNAITFRIPIPEPDASTLVNIPSYTPLWAARVTYSLDTSTEQILRTSVDLETNATKQAVLANNITALSFSRPNTTSGLITITIDAERRLSEGGNDIRTIATHMTTQAEARNP